MLSRRSVLGGVAALFAAKPAFALTTGEDGYAFSHEEMRAQDWYVGYIPDDPYDIPFVDLRRLPARARRAYVRYDGGDTAGTLVVDTAGRQLFLVQGDGRAIRYGIGVGREGFGWSGTASVGRKAVWPDWIPPAEMRRRQPELPVRMAGGLENPLGCRALYLYQDGRDTLYRIHGTNEPWSIGHAVSSGCIRMLNQDVLDLYERVPTGAVVKVRQGLRGPAYVSGGSSAGRGWGPVY